ncbi:MAG TPA: ribulose-phosphate 3-epimerase [Pirellulales bacterium]|jgi:ribulose-phosphate 3-epimerase|nr:ribulose-phosphate 3-epimerase [Pirellulales bacterium]
MIELAPSILAADFTRLGEQVSEALACGVKRIHCDIMDGHFVPNISMGPLVVQAIKPIVAKAGAILETHLMIEQPERYIADFVQAGANLVTVHVETCPHLHRTLQQIRELDAQAGVALNPATPLVMLEEILGDIDLVLVMTVNPGFGGQEFIPDSVDKIARLKKMLAERNLSHVHIEVDGGIHTGTIAAAEKAGATIAVCGTAVFNQEASIADNIAALRKAADK